MACSMFLSRGLYYGQRWEEMDHFGWTLISLQFSLVYSKIGTENSQKKVCKDQIYLQVYQVVIYSEQVNLQRSSSQHSLRIQGDDNILYTPNLNSQPSQLFSFMSYLSFPRLQYRLSFLFILSKDTVLYYLPSTDMVFGFRLKEHQLPDYLSSLIWLVSL